MQEVKELELEGLVKHGFGKLHIKQLLRLNMPFQAIQESISNYDKYLADKQTCISIQNKVGYFFRILEQEKFFSKTPAKPTALKPIGASGKRLNIDDSILRVERMQAAVTVKIAAAPQALLDAIWTEWEDCFDYLQPAEFAKQICFETYFGQDEIRERFKGRKVEPTE